MLCLYVCVCGACAVRVAGDELLALLAFVVHRVAQRARQRHQEANERDAVDEDAAWEVEAFAGRNFWEQSIMLGAVVRFDLRKPCVPTTKAKNSHVGWCMAQGQ